MTEFRRRWAHIPLSCPYKVGRTVGAGCCRSKSLLYHFLCNAFDIPCTVLTGYQRVSDMKGFDPARSPLSEPCLDDEGTPMSLVGCPCGALLVSSSEVPPAVRLAASVDASCSLCKSLRQTDAGNGFATPASWFCP